MREDALKKVAAVAGERFPRLRELRASGGHTVERVAFIPIPTVWTVVWMRRDFKANFVIEENYFVFFFLSAVNAQLRGGTRVRRATEYAIKNLKLSYRLCVIIVAPLLSPVKTPRRGYYLSLMHKLHISFTLQIS